MDVVVIAQDAQGAEVARPWVEKAGGTFRSLLDQENKLGKLYQLKYVPVGILVDEYGRLVRPVGSVNVNEDEFRSELVRWVSGKTAPASWSTSSGAELREMTPEEEEADARFQLGIVLLKNNKRDRAIDEFRAAMVLDPQNWLIRKQLWAIESPDAFYDGDVDYGWQKEQMGREEALIEG